MILIDKLKELREENELKQEDLAKVLNIARGLYSQYEIGDKFLPLYHLNTLSNFYNVSIDYILGLTNEKIYKEYSKISEIDKNKLGHNLKEFRKENKITQVQLADFLNTSHSTISAYEDGKTCILTAFLYEICKKYKISVDYLLGKVNEPKYLK